MPDSRLNGLTTLELPLLTCVHRGAGVGPFDSTPMDHLNTGIGGWPRAIGIHTPVTQIHEGLFDFAARRLDQLIALADLRGRCVPIVGKRGFIRSSLPIFYGVQTLSRDSRQLNAKMKSILPGQVSFAQAEYDKKKKRTRRELFLEQMEQVVPWARLIEVIEPHYPKSGKRGRPPMG